MQACNHVVITKEHLNVAKVQEHVLKRPHNAELLNVTTATASAAAAALAAAVLLVHCPAAACAGLVTLADDLTLG
jgi:hypothetical protein